MRLACTNIDFFLCEKSTYTSVYVYVYTFYFYFVFIFEKELIDVWIIISLCYFHIFISENEKYK